MLRPTTPCWRRRPRAVSGQGQRPRGGTMEPPRCTTFPTSSVFSARDPSRADPPRPVQSGSQPPARARPDGRPSALATLHIEKALRHASNPTVWSRRAPDRLARLAGKKRWRWAIRGSMGVAAGGRVRGHRRAPHWTRHGSYSPSGRSAAARSMKVPPPPDAGATAATTPLAAAAPPSAHRGAAQVAVQPR